MTRTLVFNGIPYTFTLRSAAQEGRWTGRYLLAVRVCPVCPTAEHEIHVLVGPPTTPVELGSLLDDALVLHLAETPEVVASTA